jgi:hypothetical protein
LVPPSLYPVSFVANANMVIVMAYIFAGMDPNGVDGSTEELPLHIALRSNPYYATKNCNEHVVELLIKVLGWRPEARVAHWPLCCALNSCCRSLPEGSKREQALRLQRKSRGVQCA